MISLVTGNEIPRDRNGKPLDSALVVMFLGKGPPIFGGLVKIGPEKSTFESSEGGIHEVSNSDIEIRIEK